MRLPFIILWNNLLLLVLDCKREKLVLETLIVWFKLLLET